jgi:beta-fructofuranosidase
MYGLPRSLWVGEDGTLRMRPVKELEKLRGPESVEASIDIPAGKEMGLKPADELMEMEISFNSTKAMQYGVKLGVSADGREETVIYYDHANKKLKFDTRKSGLGFGRKMIEEAPFELKNGEPLVLKIYIDKSIIEVFANDRQAIARMVYPTLDGRGVKVFSKGGSTRITRVKRWSITPSNPF